MDNNEQQRLTGFTGFNGFTGFTEQYTSMINNNGQQWTTMDNNEQQ